MKIFKKSDKLERGSRFYDNLYTKDFRENYRLQPYRNSRFFYVLREFDKIFKKDNKIHILDYGCGDGCFINVLTNKYNISQKNVFGFETSKK